MTTRSFGPLISVDALAARLGDPDLVMCEVDERPLVYHQGHVPGASNLDWHADLQDPVSRDLPDAGAIRELWSRVGITAKTDVVLYGDQHNWYAAFAYWLFKLNGLRRVAILDGGRQAWLAAGKEMTREVPPPADGTAPKPKLDSTLRASAESVVALLRAGGTLVDVRTAAEYRGSVHSEAGYPQEAAQRAGHIPQAIHVPWERAIGPDGRFLDVEALRQVMGGFGVEAERPAITYCRIGERSAHTWFVLRELLGLRDVRNYDGSWTEWGSMVGLPVARGDEPGTLPDIVERLEPA